MTLREYLYMKYDGGSVALTRVEATALGIPYPLRTGWLQEHGDTLMSDDVREAIIVGMSGKKNKHKLTPQQYRLRAAELLRR